MLDVDIAGDKLRALLRHGPQYSFPALVDERDFVKVHDAPALPGRVVCLLPACSQFLGPRPDEAAFQVPPFFRGCVGKRDLQHFPPRP